MHLSLSRSTLVCLNMAYDECVLHFSCQVTWAIFVSFLSGCSFIYIDSRFKLLPLKLCLLEFYTFLALKVIVLFLKGIN